MAEEKKKKKKKSVKETFKDIMTGAEKGSALDKRIHNSKGNAKDVGIEPPKKKGKTLLEWYKRGGGKVGK